MSRAHCTAPAAAFTILEVLLALAIVALVMAALGPALVGSLRAERHARATLGPLVDEPAAFGRLRDDLLAAPRPTGTLAVPFTVATAMVEGRRGDTLTVFTCPPPPLHPALAARAPEVGQAEVTWAVQAAADKRGLAWTRSRRATLLATGIVADPVPEVVLDHLASLTVEAWNGSAFTTSYDSSSLDAVLPLAVRVTWRRLLDDGSDGPLQSVVIDLPQVALDPTQSGSSS